jgi:(1->4)-alpha-D-glucan 1-alpha-D-glucosylmutase
MTGDEVIIDRGRTRVSDLMKEFPFAVLKLRPPGRMHDR